MKERHSLSEFFLAHQWQHFGYRDVVTSLCCLHLILFTLLNKMATHVVDKPSSTESTDDSESKSKNRYVTYVRRCESTMNSK